jgi:hypothetical protein
MYVQENVPFSLSFFLLIVVEMDGVWGMAFGQSTKDQLAGPLALTADIPPGSDCKLSE